MWLKTQISTELDSPTGRMRNLQVLLLRSAIFREYRENSFQFSPLLWNNILPEIRLAPTLLGFQKPINTCLFQRGLDQGKGNPPPMDRGHVRYFFVAALFCHCFIQHYHSKHLRGHQNGISQQIMKKFLMILMKEINNMIASASTLLFHC